ncbi:Arm DNA-binding domain-containing protein [Bacillus licheniformis]|nr:Arm DNA-binding domain-containing protein [Bacillus licheniformis]
MNLVCLSIKTRKGEHIIYHILYKQKWRIQTDKRRGFKSSGEAKRAEAETLLRLETDDGEMKIIQL